jgi:hypothetical protein
MASLHQIPPKLSTQVIMTSSITGASVLRGQDNNNIASPRMCENGSKKSALDERFRSLWLFLECSESRHFPNYTCGRQRWNVLRPYETNAFLWFKFTFCAFNRICFVYSQIHIWITKDLSCISTQAFWWHLFSNERKRKNNWQHILDQIVWPL